MRRPKKRPQSIVDVAQSEKYGRVVQAKEFLMISALISKESERLDRKIKQLEQHVNKSQTIILSCNKNGSSYRWKCRNIDRSVAFGLPKSDIEKAKKLARETYNRYLLEDCIKEKKALDYYLIHRALEDGKSEKYIANPEVSRLLQIPYSSKDKALEEWANAQYTPNPSHPENLTVRSITGRMVRSKSEAIIDMLLQQNGIPHRYEDEFNVNDISLRPDFTIRHPKTAEFFIWEHLGLMDNSTYFGSAFEKMKLYASQGFYPFINLIITSESADHPLDIELVNAIINHFFK